VLAVLVPAGVAMYENWPASARLYTPPAASETSHWARWLRDETPPDTVIACLPFPSGGTVQDYEPEARWVYWQTVHRRRMVNGYSGFFPQDYWTLRDALQDFPSDGALDALADRGVTRCVLDGAALSQDQWDALGSFEDRLRQVHLDEERQIALYELLPRGE
jgi:hypothetical protein